MKNKIDLKKSISELGGWKWNSPIPEKDNSSYEEYNFFILHKKPIEDYELKDVYFMIEQRECLEYMVPIALEGLSKDILEDAESYPAALLCELLQLNAEFWAANKNSYELLMELIDQNLDRIDSTYFIESIDQHLKDSLNTFMSLKI